MKPIVLIIIGCLLYAYDSRNNQHSAETLEAPEQVATTEENINDPQVTLIYNQLVNGYRVRIIWFPHGGYGEMGNAFLTFTHNSGIPRFTIATNNYTSFDTRILADSLERFTDGQVINLDYRPPRGDRTFDGHSPFFFHDVDFDGKDELLITEWQGGAKGSSKYGAYKMQEYHADKLTRKPFDYITDDDLYDNEHKTITRWSEDGFRYSIKEVYGCHQNDYNVSHHFVREILDDFYYPIKLDSLLIFENDQVSIYARSRDKLELIKTLNRE